MTVWKGKITEELRELYRRYMDENAGFEPDGYDELNYDVMTYEDFVGYIKEALRRHCCIVDVVE